MSDRRALIAEMLQYKKGDGEPGYGTALLKRGADALAESERELQALRDKVARLESSDEEGDVQCESCGKIVDCDDAILYDPSEVVWVCRPCMTENYDPNEDRRVP